MVHREQKEIKEILAYLDHQVEMEKMVLRLVQCLLDKSNFKSILRELWVHLAHKDNLEKKVIRESLVCRAKGGPKEVKENRFKSLMKISRCKLIVYRDQVDRLGHEALLAKLVYPV